MAEEELFQCKECGFHYIDQTTAARCEEWCSAHHSCNLEIIKDAVENREYESKRIDADQNAE
ncbi:MAG: hypothetical protein HY459_00130 [Parcubacteria group bacterium]|nr:hypothetical protein [Parcubacteria group bacterium]